MGVKNGLIIALGHWASKWWSQDADPGLGVHILDEEPSDGPGDRGVNPRADFLVCLQAL